MKPKLILCLVLILFANSVFASWDEIHVLPNLPADWNVPVSVQVTDVDFGKHFTVFLKDIGTGSDEFLHARLEVSSEDNQISSCPVEKNWTTNGVRFEFTVSAAYVRASKFTINEEGHLGKQPMPSVLSYWFYLRDFATNNSPVAGRTDSSQVAPKIIKALSSRIWALHSGTTTDEVWMQLNLTAYKNRLGGVSYPEDERFWLNWNYEIEFTFEKATNDFTIEKTADGKSSFYKDNRKLIQAILYKNGLEICRSGK
jgi:hypothetical protein